MTLSLGAPSSSGYFISKDGRRHEKDPGHVWSFLKARGLDLPPSSVGDYENPTAVATFSGTACSGVRCSRELLGRAVAAGGEVNTPGRV